MARKQIRKIRQRPPTSGSFKAGTDAPRKAAANNQTRYRDEVTQTLISILNETQPGTDKKKLYVMLDRLVALGLGVEFKIKGKTFQFAPDRKAIADVLDRLIGRPKQTLDIKPEGGKLVMVFGEDDANEMA